jgi:pimeloyl-ACP methyl ester carboxylesterase
MTTPIICWLPGWASDFSLWKGLIESRYPNAIHRLVPYSKMLLHRDCLETLPELQGVSLVIGWSLGSLLAFQTAPRLPKGVPLLAICPVGWFCHPELGWAPRVVLRMANKLLQDPRAVLTSFAEQMGPAPAEEKSAWIAQALQIPIPDLVLGLEILATPSISTRFSICNIFRACIQTN